MQYILIMNWVWVVLFLRECFAVFSEQFFNKKVSESRPKLLLLLFFINFIIKFG